MSIIRIGLAETKHFSEGYASIFGGSAKKDQAKKPAKKAKAAKTSPKASKKKGKK